MTLPAVYLVGPRERVASGRIYVWLADWIAEHGETLPPDAKLHNAGRALIELPVRTFRDLHVGEETK